MEIFLLTFGTIITFFTFYYQFQKQPNKEVSDLKEMVLVQFKINQKLSIDLIFSYLKQFCKIRLSKTVFSYFLYDSLKI